jgi:hypothetical protein
MGPGAAWLYPFEHECVYNVYWAPHNNFSMAMRLVVGDLGENDDLEYAETDEGLPSREDVSGSLDELSERNEGCERPFQMPAGVLGTDALAAANTRDEGGVSFEMVATELGYDFVPSEERKRRPTTKLPVGSPPR